MQFDREGSVEGWFGRLGGARELSIAMEEEGGIKVIWSSLT